MNSLLQIQQVSTFYGDFQALYDVNLRVAPGQTFAVIGANGAGKSTLLKTLAGLLQPRSGSVLLEGTPVEKWPAPARVEAGISLVPEGRRIFPSLTVEENLLVGAHAGRPGPWDRAGIYDLFPLLVKLKDRPAGLLSGGEQQAVAIGRALMSNPRLLLLDEVSLGLAPIVVRHFYDAIRQLKEQGMTIVVVEQDIGQVMSVADQVACFCQGRVVLDGCPADLTREQITTAYFGV
jgi:branched-chain amino acid transport system ATP-binding protein